MPRSGRAHGALKLYFDGGCQPNPGPIEIAVVARGQIYRAAGLGVGTNDDAEWLALLHALEVARGLGARDIILIGDSALVVNQSMGKAKCRSATLRRHLVVFLAEKAKFDRIRLRHVGRHHNLAGIALDRAR
ncbi:MAG TPA: ribonuclease HI family protein [Sphingomonas sp.]|nr:ribonuclease HI family protein [Sphingomonas sp.]